MVDSTPLTPIPSSWLSRALPEAGFEGIEMFSGWDRSAFDEGRDLYLVVQARAGAPRGSPAALP
jgi:hypothetical protein